jgi:hypothetical protein
LSEDAGSNDTNEATKKTDYMPRTRPGHVRTAGIKGM